MFPKKRCGARHRHGGGTCRGIPMKNGRCRFHGGKSTGAKTAEGKARQKAANRPAFQAWLARMWELKRAGLISRFPMGRKKGVPQKRVPAPPLVVGKPSIEPPQDPTAGMSPEQLVRAGLVAIEVLRERLLKPR